jgi:hypothetical protein
VSAIVNDDDDLLGYVARLESMTDADDDDVMAAEVDDEDDADGDDTVGGERGADPLPAEVDGDDLMAELERFLRDQPND